MRSSLKPIRARVERLLAEQQRRQGSGLAALVATLQDRTTPRPEWTVEEEWEHKCALWKAVGWGEPSRALFEKWHEDDLRRAAACRAVSDAGRVGGGHR